MAPSQASSSASSSTAASPHPSHRPHDSSPLPPSSAPPPPHQHQHHHPPAGAAHDRHSDADKGTETVEVITTSPVARMMLPPLGADADTLLAVGRHLDQNVPDALVPRPKKHEMPEKCLTFCTQRADAPALCRMLCLRKRPMAEKREEVLRRLRPPNLRQQQQQQQQQEHEASHDHEQRGESSRAGAAAASGSGWSFNPFEALKKRIEPYSIIYVRGLPDGVVGRYMEELEYDDGVRDFGEISRGMEASNRRRRIDPGPVWMEWGDDGALLHIPLIYYLRPWLSFSETVEKATAPARNLLKMYTTSFTDGSQLRNLQLFRTELTSGAPFAVIGKMREYWTKKIAERKEEMEKLRKEVMATREAEVKARLAKREEQRAADAAATASASQDEVAVRKVMDRLNQSKRARDQDGSNHAPASAGTSDEDGIRR